MSVKYDSKNMSSPSKPSDDSPSSKMAKAKNLIRDGKLDEAYGILMTLRAKKWVKREAYQQLINVCAFQGYIDEFVELYTEAIRAGLGGKVYLNQFYYNGIRKVSDTETIQRLIDFFRQTIDGNESEVDKFTYLCLSDLYVRSGEIERSISINQECLYRSVIKSEKLRSLHQSNAENKTLRAPDFIIIGTLKSGTTSLYDYLVKHPRLIPSLVKEVRFFSSHFDRGRDWYFSNFPDTIPPGFRTGEATPGYFSSIHAPERLYSTTPNAKLILCLRDPVDRALSHYFMAVREGREVENLTHLIERVENIVNHSDSLGDKELSRIPDAFSDSFYYRHLQKWLNKFSINQIMIVKSEDLFESPQVVLDRICDFLEVDRFSFNDLKIVNEGNYEAVIPEIRQKIENLYRSDFNKLRQYISN